MKGIFKSIQSQFYRVKSIGYTPNMDSYERRRLGIFNLINFFGLLTGIITPIAGLAGNGYLPPIAWVVACSPAFISAVVLICNHFKKYQFSMLWYFILYPTITALVYTGSINVGIELFFILYGVLGVFFLQNLRSIFFVICFSITCYFFVHIVQRDYQYMLVNINYNFFVFNQLLAITFIFIGLFLIKKENSGYQLEMIHAYAELKDTNEEILQQRMELADKAYLLEEQTVQLTELNAVKSRLFSIISHDLKTPIYSLRNLFRNVQQYDLPGEEIKVLIPDILNDLNYTTGLMENLLQWAKSQMQGSSVNFQLLDITTMVKEVQHLMRLQAENKKVYISSKIDQPIYIYADKDMIDLVLRNLLSNAIKFTPQNGEVSLSATVKNDIVEVLVKDTGRGISDENMKKLFGDDYFTTKGTANETGTGLGLILCKEFLGKNGGAIHVESELGKGSVFSFTLPKA